MTQSRKPEALDQHEEIKRRVRPLGITEGAIEVNPEDEDGVYHWFTNLPYQRQQDERNPQEVIHYLKEMYERSRRNESDREEDEE